MFGPGGFTPEHPGSTQDEEPRVPRRLFGFVFSLRPRRRLVIRPVLEDPERGPPCPVCYAILSRAQWLAACAVCLTVYHRVCFPTPRSCPHPECVREHLRALEDSLPSRPPGLAPR